MPNAGIPPGIFGHSFGLGGASLIQLLAGVSPKSNRSPHPKPTPQIPADQEEDASASKHLHKALVETQPLRLKNPSWFVQPPH